MAKYYDNSDTILTFNTSTRRTTMHHLFQMDHPVLPHLGYQLEICGLIGNVFPALISAKWKINPLPYMIINMKWLKISLPLSHPRCYYSGILVQYIIRESNSDNIINSEFCGKWANLSLISSSADIEFYHNKQITLFGSYGFFIAYNFEDSHTLYRTAAQMRIVCTYKMCYPSKPVIVKSAWLPDVTITWHIKSDLPVRIVDVMCKSTGPAVNDRDNMVFHDGPGILSPTIPSHLSYDAKISVHTYRSKSSTFQMFIKGIQPLIHNLSESHLLHICKYRTKLMKLSQHSSQGCLNSKVNHPNSNLQKIYLSATDNPRHNTVCQWPFQFHSYIPMQFTLHHFSWTMKHNEYYNEDIDMQFSDVNLCLHGGLYIYEFYQNAPQVTVLHWCSASKGNLPQISFNIGSDQQLVILLITYYAYSSVDMLASLRQTYMNCLTYTYNMHNEDIQSNVDLTFKNDNTYFIFLTKYESIVRCFTLIYTAGENRVLYNADNKYNISFKIPSNIGPTDIYLTYGINPSFSVAAKSIILLLEIESGHLFYPRTGTQQNKYHISSHGKMLNIANPLHIHATEIISIDIGLTRIIGLTMISKMFCSNGNLIWENQALGYAHIHTRDYERLMIKRVPKKPECLEILMDSFRQEQQVRITEVFIKVNASNSGSIIRIYPMNAHQTNCSINETIFLHEMHSKLDIVYRYIFKNTAARTIEWHSMFDSDVYLHIHKNVLHGYKQCTEYFNKSVMVVYKPTFNTANILDHIPSKHQTFRLYTARYVLQYSATFIAQMSSKESLYFFIIIRNICPVGHNLVCNIKGSIWQG
jgi:hypothetical protein